MRANHPTVALGLLIASAFLTSCNNNGGGGGTESRLSGTLAMGPLEGATVEVFELLDTGQSGDLLFATTSGSGNAFEAILRDYEGMVLIRATGGTTTNPATGQAESVPSDHPLIGFADILQGADAVVQVSPLTTLAYPLLVVLCNEPDSRAKDQVENALRMVGNFFGISRLSEVVPGDLTAGPVLPGPAANAAAAIAAISQAGAVYGMGTMTTVTRIGEDLQDLKGDGMRFGVPFSTGGGPGSLTFELRAALTTFLLVGRGQVSGIAPIGTAPWDAFTGNLNGDVVPPTAVWAMDGAYGDVRETVSARIFLDPNATTPGVATYEVRVQDLILPVTNISSSELAVDIPADLAPGSYDICLKSFATGLTTRVIKAINVGDSQATPVVSNFFPNRAPVVGGTLVTFTGDHLYPTTEIRLDGVLVPHVECHAPKRLVVAVPPRTEGVVDVEIRNPTATALLFPAGFTYTKSDLAGQALVPAKEAKLKLHVTKLLVSPAGGPTLSTFLATMTPLNADFGTFLLREASLGLDAAGLSTLPRTGLAFLGHEIRRRSILLSDVANQRDDFLRMDVNPRTSIFAGATNDGFATGWVQPTHGNLSTIAGRYSVSGLVMDRESASAGKSFGWMEIDATGSGSVNVLQYKRAWAGGSQSVEYFQDTFHGRLTAEGDFEAANTRFPSRAYRGAFDGSGSVACLTLEDSDCLRSFTLQRIEHGQSSRGFGHFQGASIHQTSPSGVPALERRKSAWLHESQLDGQSHAVLVEQKIPVGGASAEVSEHQRARFTTYYVSTSGIARAESGEICGVNSEGAGTWLDAGNMNPSSTALVNPDAPLGHGFAVHADQNFSAKSLSGDYAFIESNTAFLEHGPPGAPPTQQTEMRSRFEPILAASGIHGGWQGRPVALSGIIPTWESGFTSGLEKRVTRLPSGVMASSTLVPQVFGGKVLYVGIDDHIHLIATESTIIQGRLAQIPEFPHLIASLQISSDGEVALGTEPLGSANTAEYALIRRLSTPTLPAGTYEAAFLSQEFGSGTSPSKDYLAANGQVDFQPGSSFTQNLDWALLQQNGQVLQGAAAGLGFISTIPQGFLGLQLPNLSPPVVARECVGQVTPSKDFGLFIDMTVGTPIMSRIYLLKPSGTGTPFASSYSLHGVSYEFPSAVTQPTAERVTSATVHFSPPLGQINYLGVARARSNETPTTVNEPLFRSAFSTFYGPGQGTISFQGSTSTFEFFVNDRGRALVRTSFLSLQRLTLFAGMSK